MTRTGFVKKRPRCPSEESVLPVPATARTLKSKRYFTRWIMRGYVQLNTFHYIFSSSYLRKEKVAKLYLSKRLVRVKRRHLRPPPECFIVSVTCSAFSEKSFDRVRKVKFTAIKHAVTIQRVKKLLIKKQNIHLFQKNLPKVYNFFFRDSNF